ncbi:Sugar (pentulose or hexulose) kinase [bacterium A37T11]|nr:Sugar (pentulose or hexulose) kinase [bacterium A37T11]
MKVIAVFDVGKTNKKLFLFNEQYKIVFERSARFLETTDEDGDPCENLESLRLSVFDSLHEVFRNPQYEVKAINFSSYGASFVYVDEIGKPLAPLYNYLKPYPPRLKEKFYNTYGGEERIAFETASPILGNLNSGMQLYRLKYEQPAIFEKIAYALHLPQYLSFLISGQFYSDITSIGCHTGLWDFAKNKYHAWVYAEGLANKLAPIVPSDQVFPATFPGSTYTVGAGLHDSSAALIPYLVSFHEPFILISTGTWSISLHPFNNKPLTAEELAADCLCYMHYQGKPVKASRIFAGHEYEEQVKRIAQHFNQSVGKYRTLAYQPALHQKLRESVAHIPLEKGATESVFSKRELSDFADDTTAYHQLMADLVALQVLATNRVLKDKPVNRIFVDGGFSKNAVFMNMLAAAYPSMEIYAASMAQATAMGAALAIHSYWNSKPLPNDLIELKYYANSGQVIKLERS